MRYPDFARVPLAILSAGLVAGAICQLPGPTLLYVLDAVGGLVWFAILLYVAAALLRPSAELWETRYDRRVYRNP